MMFWENHLPALAWLRTYNSGFLKKDVLAGTTLAAYAIPVSLAYASLAGLPPQYGIYGYLLGGIFYAFIGSSRQLAIGPTSAISLLIGVTIANMAYGNPQRWADIASFTALVFAGLSLLAYFLRLSGIINFISDTVMLGFKAGAALAIATTQLPKLFGVPGGGSNFFSQLVVLAQQWPCLWYNRAFIANSGGEIFPRQAHSHSGGDCLYTSRHSNTPGKYWIKHRGINSCRFTSISYTRFRCRRSG